MKANRAPCPLAVCLGLVTVSPATEFGAEGVYLAGAVTASSDSTTRVTGGTRGDRTGDRAVPVEEQMRKEWP